MSATSKVGRCIVLSSHLDWQWRKVFGGAVDVSQMLQCQMHIPHGGCDLGVAQELLDRQNVHAGFQKMCGEAMAQGMRSAAVINSELIA
jgi:hypothetical protein